MPGLGELFPGKVELFPGRSDYFEVCRIISAWVELFPE